MQGYSGKRLVHKAVYCSAVVVNSIEVEILPATMNAVPEWMNYNEVNIQFRHQAPQLRNG